LCHAAAAHYLLPERCPLSVLLEISVKIERVLILHNQSEKQELAGIPKASDLNRQFEENTVAFLKCNGSQPQKRYGMSAWCNIKLNPGTIFLMVSSWTSYLL